MVDMLDLKIKPSRKGSMRSYLKMKDIISRTKYKEHSRKKVD